MRGSVFQFLLLAHVAYAITGPRIENEYDRSRQPPGDHPGFNEHQTRFGINSPLQNFQQQPSLLTSPPPPTIQFQQSIFQQPQLQAPQHQQPSHQHQQPSHQHQQLPHQHQQQPYVPQFSNIPTQGIPSNLPVQNIPSNVPVGNNHAFQFNQNPNVNPNNFPQQNFRQISQQNQNILPQSVPTLATFQNVLPIAQNAPAFNPNPNIQGNVGNVGQQRPTQAAFLPTLSSPQNQPIFGQPSPITIHPAPNLAPQNLNLENSQFPFQSQFNQFTNGQLQNYYEQQSKENLEKLKELQERQRIIQKHQEFVEKQQQKEQQKVEKLHEEFLTKQATKTIPTHATTESYDNFYTQSHDRHRPLQPHETDLFRKALELYEKEHPTTTTSTTTTTTTTTTIRPPTHRYRTRPTSRPRSPPQDRNKQKLYNEIKNLLDESETKGFDDNLRAKSVELLQKPDILKQLKVVLAENPEDFNEKNFSSREISLNGQKFEVIRTTNPNLIPKGAITADSSNIAKIVTANQEQQKENPVSFEDLTKGVLPPGANFELIKQSDNGKLEEVSKLPNTIQNKKKVTFVFLEEQDDGSFKVKGVKANGQQTEEGPEVESIINKIKKGEIQLPGSTKISNAGHTSTTAAPTNPTTNYVSESSLNPSSYNSFVTTSNYGTSGHNNPVIHTTTPVTYQNTEQPSRATQNQAQSYYQNTEQPSRTTQHQAQSYYQTTEQPLRTTEHEAQSYYQHTDQSSRKSQYQAQTYSPLPPRTTTERFVLKSSAPRYIINRNNQDQTSRASFPSSTIVNTTPTHRTTTESLVVIGSSTVPPTFEEPKSFPEISENANPSLVDILKENGLFATAKYLRQSGLDTILNETGPYTIFAPTDKAFRTLLVQLGGPDKAEEKFRDNPRLLSGLLLHHVIPGAFDIASLQDEMTGVSLAGTQLRVNQYDMHDVEWNEVRVTTINGARVLEDKKDIHIPQGIAHAVDRVMFPLPVGDIIQTLQADRDRRFTTFLKAIQASGFADTLSESKTYTVFAPTDAAFARLSAHEVARLADKAGARALVARHVLPGTLYSAGMRYYQLRNSMEDAKPLTLQKNSGRIKVNNAQVVTHNIPATNGVIHAIDNIL
ncbi:unnamed protein product [Parnassius mnemosyne]|uniref:FAS1 domain-containing protein n=1 Tax=Parnassius mnemosyne TaxID=213953 RepID=A0AAV1MB50_9NEOP